ncbi:MAG: DUF3445 domain-containing protein [Acidimicrobiales bacterium]|nr:DUF3445 domain-containing protein [Acidimicrobiales bacterium]
MLNRSSLTAADLISTDPEPFKWRMGVRPLRLEQWLLVDADRDADLNEINAIIDRHRDEIIYCEPTAAAACKELATLVIEHLRHVPQLNKVELNSRPDMHIIEATRRLVQEDICLLERRREGWVMTACAVAIPTQWDVPSKFGNTLDSIHEPVPRYDTDLAQTMGTFFDRLRTDRPVWRANRTLTDDPSLRLAPKRRHEPLRRDITATNVAESVWLRVEYQTLRRLPKTDAIVFTIRILRQRIASVAQHPTALTELIRWLSTLPEEVRSYKDSTVRHGLLVKQWAIEHAHIDEQQDH